MAKRGRKTSEENKTTISSYVPLSMAMEVLKIAKKENASESAVIAGLLQLGLDITRQTKERVT